MVYKSFLPSASLADVVRNYTIIHLKFQGKEPVPNKQRSPKPEQKIVFYLKGTPKFYSSSTASLQTPPPVAIFSHQSDKKTIHLTADFSAFIIFFQPGVLHRLMKLPMTELLDRFCDAEIFFGADVRQISDRLATAKSESSMIEVAEQFLLTVCRTLKDKSPIDTIALQVLSDPTAFSLDTFAHKACLSTKQFYRKFNERIGISPKLFSRLSRFNHAYQYKLANPSTSWSSIAQELCYTDYHHMEKEFKEFTKLTPEEWTKAYLTSPEKILRLR